MKFALFATALLFTGGVAVAQTAAPAAATPQGATQARMVERAAARFDRRDANGDGVLDAEDAAARADRAFARLDGNGDGQISRAEWDAARSSRAGRRHARAERGGAERRLARRADRNGRVTRAEALARAVERFSALDANGDGVVTRVERRASRPGAR